MHPRSEDPKLIIRVINFELVQPICSRYVNVTDGRTDGRTTYYSNTALALRASHGKNVEAELLCTRTTFSQSMRRHHYATSVWYLSIFESRSTKPITVTCFCHCSCCLAYVRYLASLYFSKTMLRHRRHTSFQKLILRCGEIFNKCLIPNFLLSLTVTELWTSFNIWRSYGQEFVVLFFDSRCRLLYALA